MKKRLSLLISMILILALFVSCGSGNSSTGSDNGDGKGTPKPAETGKLPKETKGAPVKLTMMVQNHPVQPFREDWLVWKLHEKNANVELDVSGYQGDWWDAITLIVASGDMPDLMWMVNQDAMKYGEQGAVVDLLEHLDEMPNLRAFMEKYPEETPPLYSSGGKLYLHPSHGAFGDYNSMWLYRKDIFEKNQLDLPKNYDEFYETLLKLKECYPESYPLYASGLDIFNTLGISYGVQQVIFYDPFSQSVKFGPAEDNYKPLLEFITKAYRDRLIPLEFGNLSNEKLEEMLSTDKTFIYRGWFEEHFEKYNEIMREDNPDFTLAFMPPPEGPAGAYNDYKSLLQEGLVVTTTSRQMEAALQFVDYLFTEEGKEAVSWGEEGTTFEVVNGKKQFLPAVSNGATAGIEFGLRTSGNMAWVDTDAMEALMTEETAAIYQEGLKYVAPMSILPPLTKEEAESITIKQEAIGKYADETISKIVIGQKSIDEWDAFREELKRLGLDDVLSVYNHAAERREQKLK